MAYHVPPERWSATHLGVVAGMTVMVIVKTVITFGAIKYFWSG